MAEETAILCQPLAEKRLWEDDDDDEEEEEEGSQFGEKGDWGSGGWWKPRVA